MSCVMTIPQAGRKEPMGEFIKSQGWQNCLQTRARQRYWGALCALLLGFALLGILDGLQGLARSGADVIELLPGGSVSISGPLTIKNPVNSDLKAQFTPENPALFYDLEGFFAGYWFGNGMWRGSVRADAVAEPGSYGLKVSFRGAAASTTQHYTVVVHADETAMRAASTSYLRRITGYNPFVLAAGCCGLALLGGVVVFRLGSKYIRQLTTLGCGEIVRVEQNADTAAQAQSGHIWCLLYGLRAPAKGTPCAVYDAQGMPLGTARAQEAKNGTLELNFDSITSPAAEAGATNTAVRPGCLVQLRPPRPLSPPVTDR